jgi:hypothetical protein
MDRISVSTPQLWGAYQSLWRLMNVQEGDTHEEHVALVAAHGDFPVSLEQHLRWLTDAGFEPACLHLHTNRALIAARKS